MASFVDEGLTAELYEQASDLMTVMAETTRKMVERIGPQHAAENAAGLLLQGDVSAKALALALGIALVKLTERDD